MGRKSFLGFFLMACLFLWIAPSYTLAVRLHPDLVEKFRKEGKLAGYVEAMKAARAQGVWPMDETPLTQKMAQSAAPDTLRVVVLLVEFTDNLAANGPYADTAYFNRLLFSQGVLPTGSMKEFYLENSYGKFVVVGEAYGWFMMPQTYAYYVNRQMGFGTYPRNAQKLVEAAVAVADPYVNFNPYGNGDAMVDGLIVVHAGPGYEVTGDSNMIHSHVNHTYQNVPTADGVSISLYSIQPEEASIAPAELIQVGVFCHEFGHILGLPDLYDTDYSSEGVGNWSLMASGSYNGGSALPAELDPWSKIQLGWLTPNKIRNNVRDQQFPQVETSGYVARIWSGGVVTGAEYFLIENRQRIGFDVALPNEGLLIWHIDERYHNNNTEYKYMVALEQADGKFDLEKGRNRGDAGDIYPGDLNQREFSEMTLPNSFSNFGDTTKVAVWAISNPDSLMTASLDIQYSRPRYELVEDHLAEISGDGDAQIEPGETYGLYVSVTNHRAFAQNVTLHLSIDNDSIIVNQPAVILGDLPPGDTLDNPSQPATFTIPMGMGSTIANLTFKVSDPSETDSIVRSFQFNVGNPAVLLVDQDGNSVKHYEHFYTDVLDSLKIPYQRYARDSMGTPTSAYLGFPRIVWFSSNGFLDSADVSFLKSYLDQGGKLFLTGQNIAESLAVGRDSAFQKEYLKASYDRSERMYFDIYGVDGSQVGGDSLRLFIVNQDGAQNQYSQDVFRDVDSEAQISLMYYSGDIAKGPAGIEYAGSYGLVFWGFGFEAINSQAYGCNTRVEALQRVLTFLDNITTDVDDGSQDNLLPRQFSLGQNYPNPFNPRTIITYELAKNVPEGVTLRIYNVLGQEVKAFVQGPQAAGTYRLEWDGTDSDARRVSSGIYFYRLIAGDISQARKMVLLK